ncbi:MAG: cyanophycin synthetase, partial [Coleofasciculaceae cyanobacterium]
PTIVVGGEVDAWDGNARLGNGPILVAEADESDGSLAKLSAKIGVITNIELDHPDHYQNLEEVVAIFQTFAKRCQVLIGCLDCETLRAQIQPTISYSLHRESGADYSVDGVNYHADGTIAQVWEKEQFLGELHLKLLGTHNLSNALAAVAVGRHLGLDFEVINAALSSFEGAKRRFELRGICHEITFVDDYAHHPSEIQVTLAAARLRVVAPQRLVAIFQPHRYSRTQTFLQEFAKSFNDADLVVITDIYSAGEPNREGITGEKLREAICLQQCFAIAEHHSQVCYQPLASVQEFLTENLKPGDFALFLGAGNLNQIIPQVMDFYNQQELNQKT